MVCDDVWRPKICDAIMDWSFLSIALLLVRSLLA